MVFNIVIMWKHKTYEIICTIDLTSVKHFSKICNLTTYSFCKKYSRLYSRFPVKQLWKDVNKISKTLQKIL